MGHRKLVTLMSILMLICVYAAVYVVLPVGSARVTKGYNEQDTQEAKDLSGRTVVIDSGHGGMDSGKEGSDGTLEKDINLSIAFKLKELLEQSNINVVMTRSDSNGLYSESDSNKKIADMKKRCAIIDESNADVVISIHQNSFQSASVKGAQVFYYKHSAKGKELAGILQKAFKQYLDPSNSRLEKADSTYYMLIHTSTPTVIAECGFLSNPEELAKLQTEEYQQKVAEALFNGTKEYLEK